MPRYHMKTFKIAFYELKKIMRNWRWIALFLLQPIAATLLLGLAADHKPKDINIALYDKNKNQYSNQITDDLFNEKRLSINVLSNEEDVRKQLEDNKASLGIIIDVARRGQKISGSVELIDNVTTPEITGEAKILFSDLTKDTLTKFAQDNATDQIDSRVKSESEQKSNDLNSAVSRLKDQIALLPLPAQNLQDLNESLNSIKVDSTIAVDNVAIDGQNISLNETRNTNRELKYFDFYAPALIILLIVFIGMNRTATTITEERQNGTFERFFVTPFTKSNMIFGKMLAYTTASIVLAGIITAILSLVFNAALGPIWLVVLIAVITGLTAVALGLLISSFTYNTEESINVSVLLFFIFLILTTLIFQNETMHPIAVFLSKIIPFTYSIIIMREVNLLNLGFYDIWPGLAILIAYLFAFLFLSAIVLRRKAT